MINIINEKYKENLHKVLDFLIDEINKRDFPEQELFDLDLIGCYHDEKIDENIYTDFYAETTESIDGSLDVEECGIRTNQFHDQICFDDLEEENV